MTTLPRPGPTDYLDTPGVELDILLDSYADAIEAVEDKANAALPATHAAVGTLIAAAADKVTPADADNIALSDSAAGNILRRFSWANIKASLSSVFALVTDLTAHTGAASPHTGHATTAALTAHTGASAPHSGHPVSAGSAGGQTVRGGTGSGEGLTLGSTSHATKGAVAVGGVLTVREDTLRCGIAQASPTARLHLPAGSASASTAPLKIDSGTLMTTPEAGSVEFSSSRMFFTPSTALGRSRVMLDSYSSGSPSLPYIGNAYGYMGDNYGFSQFVFDAADGMDGAGSFTCISAGAVVLTDFYVPIDPKLAYFFSAFLKSGNPDGSQYEPARIHYCGFRQYDADFLLIEQDYSLGITGAVNTTIVSALNPGDTTINLNSASGWNNNSTVRNNNFCWWPYIDGKGQKWPDYTYSRNTSINYSGNFTNGAWVSGGVSGNSITLRVPWAGPTLPAGTPVRNALSIGTETHAYVLLMGSTLTNSWSQRTAVVGGLSTSGSDWDARFRYGAKYVRFIVIPNYGGSSDNIVKMCSLRMECVDNANQFSASSVGATYNALMRKSLPANGLIVEGRVGAGTSSPSAKMHAVAASGAQLRLAIDGTTYTDLTASSAGLKISNPIVWRPASSVSLSVNGDLAIELTSNTQVRILARGSDGVTRSAMLTLT